MQNLAKRPRHAFNGGKKELLILIINHSINGKMQPIKLTKLYLDSYVVVVFFPFISSHCFWNCNDQSRKINQQQPSSQHHNTQRNNRVHKSPSFSYHFVRYYFSFWFDTLEQQFAWSNCDFQLSRFLYAHTSKSQKYHVIIYKKRPTQCP